MKIPSGESISDSDIAVASKFLLLCVLGFMFCCRIVPLCLFEVVSHSFAWRIRPGVVLAASAASCAGPPEYRRAKGSVFSCFIFAGFKFLASAGEPCSRCKFSTIDRLGGELSCNHLKTRASSSSSESSLAASLSIVANLRFKDFNDLKEFQTLLIFDFFDFSSSSFKVSELEILKEVLNG